MIITVTCYIIIFSARTCGTPGVIPNGWHQGDCSDFGCRVFYKCSDGFELIGKSERLCHSDGYWVPKDLPACVRKYFNTELASTHGCSLTIPIANRPTGLNHCVSVNINRYKTLPRSNDTHKP